MQFIVKEDSYHSDAQVQVITYLNHAAYIRSEREIGADRQLVVSLTSLLSIHRSSDVSRISRERHACHISAASLISFLRTCDLPVAFATTWIPR
jgi:hypothetical protein